MKFLTPIILLLASVGLFYVVINPQYEKINQIRADIKKYDEAIEKAQSVEQKRNDLLTRRNSFNADDLKKLQKLLPDNVDNIRLIIDLNKIAGNYGAIIKDIKTATGALEKDNQKVSVGSETKAYGVVSIGFKVTLTYEQLFDFLTEIEKSLRLIDVTSITFTPADTSSTYDYSINLRTYWLK